VIVLGFASGMWVAWNVDETYCWRWHSLFWLDIYSLDKRLGFGRARSEHGLNPNMMRSSNVQLCWCQNMLRAYGGGAEHQARSLNGCLRCWRWTLFLQREFMLLEQIKQGRSSLSKHVEESGHTIQCKG